MVIDMCGSVSHVLIFFKDTSIIFACDTSHVCW